MITLVMALLLLLLCQCISGNDRAEYQQKRRHSHPDHNMVRIIILWMK